MRIVWDVNWHRWILGVIIDRFTVAVYVGPFAVDFLYRWSDLQDMFADSGGQG